jgi:hypothetical protein
LANKTKIIAFFDKKTTKTFADSKKSPTFAHALRHEQSRKY